MTLRRRLGRTGHEVYPLGLGGHTYPIGNGEADYCTADERAALVKRLIDGGVNYFDTTWLNEVESLADAFRRADVGRDALVSLQYVDGISEPDWRTKLRGEIESRLQVMDYARAPLFLMGVGNNHPPYGELVAACKAMDRLKQEGLVEHIGLSCHEMDHYPLLARLIQETDLVDYMLIRFNWKFQQASETLFPVAAARDVGLVIMKVFCWDCGPGQWGRRISVFEPTPDNDDRCSGPDLNPAQSSLVWSLQHSPSAVAVPAINATWEARECLQAMTHLAVPVDTSTFASHAQRLWLEPDLRALAARSESATIRERAARLLPEG